MDGRFKPSIKNFSIVVDASMGEGRTIQTTPPHGCVIYQNIIYHYR